MGLLQSRDFLPTAYAMGGSDYLAGYGYSNDGSPHYPYYEDRGREYYENRGRTYYENRRRDYYGDRGREYLYEDRGRDPYYNAPFTFHDPHDGYRRDYGAPDPYFRSDYGAPGAFYDPYNDYRGAPVTAHNPYDNYRRDYGARRSSNDRYGVVPREQVYRQGELGPRRHDGYHDKMGHNRDRRERERVELWVPMCCDNCERLVKERLEHIQGVESVTTNQWTKKVVVVGDVRPDYVLARSQLRNKRSSEFWESRRRPH